MPETQSRIPRLGLLVVVTGAALLGSTGCEVARTEGDIDTAPAVVESLRRYRREYVLIPGDSIDILVRQAPEMSRTYIIRPDGRISLPLIGELEAAGQTLAELDETITTRLADRVKDAEVSVIAVAVQAPAVFVVGNVPRPGPIALRDAPTAAQAIASAGGFAVTADDRQVAIIRLTDEGRLRATTIEPTLEGQPASYLALQAIPLQPFDILVVPESDRSQFVRFVQDYVNTPLSGVNSLLTPYLNYRLIEEID